MQQGDFIPRRTQPVRRQGCWLGRLVAWFVVGSSLFAAGAPWLDAVLAQVGAHRGLRWALAGITLVLVAVLTLRLAIVLARKRRSPHPVTVAGKDA
jgi:hypothetical protein